MKRRLFGALIAAAGFAALLAADTFSQNKAANEKNLPVLGSLVDYVTAQTAGTILAGPCSGPASAPTFKGLCAETLAATVNAATKEGSVQPVSDLVPVYDASAAALRAVPAGFIGFAGPQAFNCGESGMFFRTTGSIYACQIADTHNANGSGLQAQAGTGNKWGVVSEAVSATAPGGSALMAGGNTTTAITQRGTLLLGQGRAVSFLIARQQGGVSDVNNRHTFYFAGYSSMDWTVASPAESNDAVYFRGVDNVNSGKWQGVARNGGSESVCDTTVSVTGDSNWHIYWIDVNAGGTNVDFYIDSSPFAASPAPKCSVNANIPITAGHETTLMPAGILSSSANATGRRVEVTAFRYIVDFTTTR